LLVCGLPMWISYSLWISLNYIGLMSMIESRSCYEHSIIMFRCLHSQSPLYLMDYCRPVTDVASRQRHRSVNRHLLHAPRYRFNMYGRRAFAVTGPSAYNSFPDCLRASDCSVDSFKHFL